MGSCHFYANWPPQGNLPHFSAASENEVPLSNKPRDRYGVTRLLANVSAALKWKLFVKYWINIIFRLFPDQKMFSLQLQHIPTNMHKVCILFSYFYFDFVFFLFFFGLVPQGLKKQLIFSLIHSENLSLYLGWHNFAFPGGGGWGRI